LQVAVLLPFWLSEVYPARGLVSRMRLRVQKSDSAMNQNAPGGDE